MRPIVSISRMGALFSYLALFFFSIFCIVTNKIYPEQPRIFLVIGLLMPLVFPARGLLRAKRFTHAWTSFLSLFYLIAATDIWASGYPAIGSVYFLLTIILFVSCILYARYSPLPFREDGSESQKAQ